MEVFKQKLSVVVMNFSGAYQLEPFAKNEKIIRVNCSDISGTDCYCSPASEQIIAGKISALSPNGIHFIDSGDYHYVSKLWTDKIAEPFRLVLFDHHTDMQKSKIPGLLTCGSWVREMLEHNKWLRQVVIFGTPAGTEKKVPAEFTNRVIIDSEQSVHRHTLPQNTPHDHLPVYVSIDKDVINPAEAVTNWDQGILTMADIQRILMTVFAKTRVIGLDVCGEFSITHSLFADYKAAEIDNEANIEIINIVKNAI